MSHNNTRVETTPSLVTARGYVDYKAPPFPSDTVTFTDSVTIEPLITTAVNDSVTLTDDVTFFVDNLRVADTAQLVDDVSNSMEFVVGFSETVTATDTSQVVRVLTLDVSDTVSVSEGNAFSYDLPLSVSDTVTMSDSAASEFSTANTWNPSDKNAVVVLSNSDHTASVPAGSGGGTFESVRGVKSKNAGKFYFEIYCDAQGQGNQLIGIGKSTASLATYAGAGADSYGLYRANASIYNNGAATYIGVAWVTGDRICVAVDLDNHKIWFRQNGGTWNGDPATNSGGYTIASGTYYPMYSAEGYLTETVTANFGDSAFTHTVPTGFSAWV